MQSQTVEAFFKEFNLRDQFQSKLIEIYREKLILDFNPLDFLSWNENKVSEIIAFFLNPHASHAQGDLYLQLFIDYFDLSFQYSDVSKVRVNVEENTESNRRVDIVISYDNYKRAIGIENKIYPWTKDQPLQVEAYVDHLKRFCKTGDYHLLYLSPRAKILDNYSAGENYEEMLADGKLKLINYEEHLIDLVHRFALETDNDRLRHFIKDFELKLRNNYIGIDMNEENDLVHYIEANEDNIKTAFSVSRNLNAVKKSLTNDFYEQMKELALDLNLQYSEQHNHFVLPNFSKLYAKFNFESRGLIYGLVKTPEFYNSYPEKFFVADIASVLNNRFSTSHWWPLWTFLYKNIEVEHQFWVDVQNGTVKETVRNFLVEVINLPENLTRNL